MKRAFLALVMFMASPSIGAAPSTFAVQVVHGDKQSTFEISKSKNGGGKIEFSGNQVASKTQDLSAEDFKYLESRVNSIPGVSNQIEFCPRSYIVVAKGKKTMVGCIGAKNKTAIEIQSIANLLAILF